MDYDEEIIGVKPPIDIIPDEYECFKEDLSEKIIVNTFCSSSLAAQNNVRTFVNSLAEGYYDVSEHSLEKDNCPKILETSMYEKSFCIFNINFEILLQKV